MSTVYKYFFDKFNILNFFIASIPLSMILGNLAININIFIIIILGFLSFGIKIFITKKKILNMLIYSFFFYLFAITLLNNWNLLSENILYKEHLIKSLFYLRFLLLFLIIDKLIENKSFNTKFFFISCAFFSLIISIDIIIQFFFKKNIFGFEIIIDKPSSFFGQENIAGGFIQRFIYFFIFLYLIIKKKSNNNFLIFLLLLFFLIPIILTANRMPAIIYAFSVILYFVLEKKFKAIFFSIIILCSIFLTISFTNFSNRLHTDIKIFFIDSKNIIFNAPNLFIKNELNYNFLRNDYLIHFNTGIQIWKQNKIFGNGLKSFRLKCTKQKFQTCNTHPHNYIIEIMVDTGLIGLFLIYSVFFIGLKNFLKYYQNSKNLNDKMLFAALFLSIALEFFPIRSTGSFFTTGNSVFIFLILPIFLNIEKIKKL